MSSQREFETLLIVALIIGIVVFMAVSKPILALICFAVWVLLFPMRERR